MIDSPRQISLDHARSGAAARQWIEAGLERAPKVWATIAIGGVAELRRGRYGLRTPR